MTRVVAIRELEDCFDASIEFELEISEPVSESIMHLLATGSRLEYHKDFPRPFYRIRKDGSYVIQGVIGTKTMRVLLSRSKPEESKNELVELIEGGKKNG